MFTSPWAKQTKRSQASALRLLVFPLMGSLWRWSGIWKSKQKRKGTLEKCEENRRSGLSNRQAAWKERKLSKSCQLFVAPAFPVSADCWHCLAFPSTLLPPPHGWRRGCWIWTGTQCCKGTPLPHCQVKRGSTPRAVLTPVVLEQLQKAAAERLL